MKFQKANLEIADHPLGRTAKVSMMVEGSLQEMVVLQFVDPEQPDETRAAERARLFARAKQMLTLAASTL